MIYRKLITKKDARHDSCLFLSLCDYTYLQAEAEDDVGYRTEKQLCEKAEHHCIYTLYLLAQKLSFYCNGYLGPYPRSEDRV